MKHCGVRKTDWTDNELSVAIDAARNKSATGKTERALIDAADEAVRLAGTGPDYQRLFWHPDTKAAWWESADGDEEKDVDFILARLRAVDGVASVDYEPEASPELDEGWEQLYPEVMAWRRGMAKAVTKAAGTCKPGETAASTGCTPADGGSGSSTSPSSHAATLQQADKIAEEVGDKSQALLAKFSRPAKWLKAKTKEVNAKLTAKYGVKGAAAIIGAGQVITWGITVGAPLATGLPIVVPPGGGLATSLALAGLVDLYKKLRGTTVKGETELSEEEAQRLAIELVQELIDGVMKELNDEPNTATPVNRLKRKNKGGKP